MEKAEKDLRILGFHCSPKEDCFLYSIKPNLIVAYTKRRVLSIAASIFDPMDYNGYAAVIYSRRMASEGYIMRLIAARGHVAPLKRRVSLSSRACTILNLELESVVFLTKLYRGICKTLGTVPIKFMVYTDPEVAVCWIRSRKDTDNKYREESLRSISIPCEVQT